MTRTQLARRAYDRACRALEAARDAGTISPDEALTRYRKLTAAYQTRKQELELAGFLSRRGLKRLPMFEKLDRSLATMDLEREEKRVGSTPIHTRAA
jgi:hypothetical protein